MGQRAGATVPRMAPTLRAFATAGTLAAQLGRELGGRWQAGPLRASSFCDTWRAEGPGGPLFVKTVAATMAGQLEAEADGLRALAATQTIRVPEVAGCWAEPGGGPVALALAWLDFIPATGPDAGARLGQALAALHRAPPPEGQGRYGWRRDNRLGTTVQANDWSAEDGLAGWLAFLAQARFDVQHARLAAQGAPAELLDALAAVVQALPGFFDDGYEPRASLIHGDLWSGNWGFVAAGGSGPLPVIYDPAVSCSDAEAELAMMELFGAPPPGFWEAYRAHVGLHPGYRRRRGLYQLYHLLNHALLFGGGYGAQSLRLARALLGIGTVDGARPTG